jgi:hypothetical protein
MVSSGTNKGTRSFFYFRFSNAFITQKVYFSRLKRVYIALIMSAACTWSRFLCFLLVSMVWDFPSGIGPLLPISWNIVQILRQWWRKTTNTAPTTLSAIQATSQSTFISAQLSQLLISRHDENKQLTLLCQRKLEKYTFCVIDSLVHVKNLKNGSALYLGLKLTIHVIKRQIHLVRQSL